MRFPAAKSSSWQLVGSGVVKCAGKMVYLSSELCISKLVWVADEQGGCSRAAIRDADPVFGRKRTPKSFTDLAVDESLDSGR